MKIYRRHNCDNKCGQWRRQEGPCKCGGLFVPGPWVGEYTDNHRRRRQVSAPTRGQVESKLKKRISDGRPDRQTFDAMAKKYWATKKTSTAEMERKYWALHLGPHFGSMRLSQIKRNDLLDYIAMRRSDTNQHGQPIKEGTIGREISILRGVWQYALMSGLVTHNPFLKLGVSQKKRQPINKYLLPSEWDRLFEILPEPSKYFYAFVWETAARQSEALGLTWDQIDLERKIAWVDGKTGGKQPLFLSERAIEHLEQAARWSKNNGYVFRNKYNKPLSSPSPLLRWYMSRCDLNADLTASGRSPITGTHYLRHAAISRWVMQGEELAVISRLARHTTIDMTMRYVHLAPERMHAAVNRNFSAT